ncbi:GGDEF domain-containing protein [Simiduia aestuariiviva]|uniref:diguanylate cyclase n=1 Tax=Simiduia aestuariiviva TaxID=1510459 RepID=A0A839UT56_9GAMM|nr:GGDEF domain-containing protein [Simiduia aestuariiviva]MBB3169640.1 diguanylate cyclase (GGDEF)-like protein [Simiduia aestuariiviva]
MNPDQPMKDLPEEFVQTRLRLWRDVITRARPGITLYPILWLIISASAGIMFAAPLLAWSVMGVLTVASVLRVIHMRLLERCLEQGFALWRCSMYVVVLTHSTCWGAMFALSLTMGQADFLFLMAFSSSGILAGGSNSFSPVKSLSFAYIISFILPPLVVSIWLLDSWAESILIATYLFYMLNLAGQQHREYWASLRNEMILEMQSRTDALTSLNNRRYFDEKLNELCHLSSRDHVQLAVLVVDCDHFKAINDNYGHDFGDECLRELGKILSDSLPRATDVCARYGGEEFSIILAGTDLAGAELVAERIRERVAQHKIEYLGASAQLTVSIGLTSERLKQYQPGLPERLFKRADVALYRAKQDGRNCVRVADPQMVAEDAEMDVLLTRQLR